MSYLCLYHCEICGSTENVKAYEDSEGEAWFLCTKCYQEGE